MLIEWLYDLVYGVVDWVLGLFPTSTLEIPSFAHIGEIFDAWNGLLPVKPIFLAMSFLFLVVVPIFYLVRVILWLVSYLPTIGGGG